ncbi:uncharacterized protein K489DRAFT_410577 [Dissoconium aciculare CBS 342.82]|uniref:F-box domain-containing protein n=1 Tax=Dissoconium aciculare CBS 342.82 TaxID=1314786 RepID=A0A6J3M2X5_9PEZI|nr:uncharacterized protein K489DRAFT_410577 [Dissoconium aciculare CBS 342.82]KAF1822248.1 hypothetical protein K489DRAFT_410577 [Dissoconium aciculare CBS 342.82]
MGELSGHPRPIVPVKRYRTRSSVPKSEKDGFELRQDPKDDSDDGEEARNGLRKKKPGLKTHATSLAPGPADEESNTHSFLSLPAEIRSEIYQYSLIAPDPLAFQPAGTRKLPTAERGFWRFLYKDWEAQQREYAQHEPRLNRLAPALLAINSHIHREAADVLYGGQAFTFQNYAIAYYCLSRMGAANRARMRAIRILGQAAHGAGSRTRIAPALKLLADCVQLRSLFLGHRFMRPRDPHESARELYRDGYQFFREFGAAQGRRDAVLDVLEFDRTHLEDCGFLFGAPTASASTLRSEGQQCEQAVRDHLRALLEHDEPRNGKKTHESNRTDEREE